MIRVLAVQGGSLDYAPLIRRDSLWAPELHEVDIGDCDDGFSVGPSGVVCDRPRLGHLYLGLSTLPSFSLTWTPTYRNRWGLSLDYGERVVVGAALRIW